MTGDIRRPRSSRSSCSSFCSSRSTIEKVVLLLILSLVWIAKSVWREDQWILHIRSGSGSGSGRSSSGKINKNSNNNVESRHPRLEDFKHFLVHIPKSGGSFAFDALVNLLVHQPEWQALPADQQEIMCDGRMRPTAQFEDYYPHTSKDKKYRNHLCNMWMAEQPVAHQAQHNYIILRDPREHILSQYFHCKESFDHWDRWKYMPSLTEWMEAWVAAQSNATQAKVNQHFQCYDPRNLQSRYAGTLWNKKEGGDYDDNDPKYTYDNTIYYTVRGAKETRAATSTASTRNISLSLPEQLQAQFAVVGDTSRMGPSLCLIFIRYTGGWIPPSCDCTSSSGNNHHRQLKIHFYGHGVRHHGKTYQTTPYQDELMAQLMTHDQPLYEAGHEVLTQQIQSVEQEYGIQMCQ